MGRRAQDSSSPPSRWPLRAPSCASTKRHPQVTQCISSVYPSTIGLGCGSSRNAKADEGHEGGAISASSRASHGDSLPPRPRRAQRVTPPSPLTTYSLPAEPVRHASSPTAPCSRVYRSEKESFCRAAVASSRRRPSAERVWRRNRGGGRLRLAELDLAAQTYSAGTAATSRISRSVRGPMCSAKVFPTHSRSVASMRTTPPAKAFVGSAEANSRCSSDVGSRRWLEPPCRRSCENIRQPAFSCSPATGSAKAYSSASATSPRKAGPSLVLPSTSRLFSFSAGGPPSPPPAASRTAARMSSTASAAYQPACQSLPSPWTVLMATAWKGSTRARVAAAAAAMLAQRRAPAAVCGRPISPSAAAAASGKTKKRRGQGGTP
mmetsp:Transcript_25853/g.87240  ORF Transcript_25853/g.87240 Transcript_25853/m.87240 type:complete len:378 (+) Transcript_25853:144-1277(+)